MNWFRGILGMFQFVLNSDNIQLLIQLQGAIIPMIAIIVDVPLFDFLTKSFTSFFRTAKKGSVSI